MTATYTRLADNIASMREKWSLRKNAIASTPSTQLQDNEVTQPLIFQEFYKPEHQNAAADTYYTRHSQYLNGITTSIDCETDLKLYKIQHSFSNHIMGMVGVSILSPALQDIYDSNQYLIRCYYNRQKFLEIPLNQQPYYIELFNLTIVYIFKEDLQTLHIIQIEPQQVSETDTIDVNLKKHKNKVLKYSTATQNLVQSIDEIVSIRLGHFTTASSIKMMILTNKKAFLIPITTDSTTGSPEHLKKQEKEVTLFDYTAYDPLQNSQTLSTDKDIQRNKGRAEKIPNLIQFFDFGVNSNNPGNYDESHSELLVALDSEDTIQLFVGKKYGTKFQRVNQLSFKKGDMILRQTQQKEAQVLDVALISNTKLIVIKIKNFQGGQKQENQNKDFGINTNEAEAKNRKIVMQVWEIDDNFQLAKTTSLVIPEEIVTDKFIQNWKQDILPDLLNGDVYIPNYTSTSGTYYKFKISNEIQNFFEISILTENIVKDIIGSHQKRTLHNTGVRGSLYTDFLVLDKWLVLTHGKCLTVTDIMLPRGQFQQHLTFTENKNSLKGPYDMSQEVLGLYLSDNDSSSKEYRWKIIAIFNNGVIQELAFPTNFDLSPQKSNISLKQMSSLISQPIIQPEFLLRNYLKDKYGKPHNIRGQIQKIYRSSSDNQVPLILMIQKRDKSLILAAIDYKTQILREYNLPENILTKKTTVILLNQKETQFQELMLINTDVDSQGHVQSQTKFFINLKIEVDSDDSEDSFFIYGEDEMPKEMGNIQKTNKVFVMGEEIYFVHSNYIEKYGILTEELEKVQTPDFFTSINIQDQHFAYWRQNRRKKTIFSHQSSIYFDKVESLVEMKNKGQGHDQIIFSGLQPHLDRIYYDAVGNTMCAFVDYNNIIVWPMLHKTHFKLKNGGKRMADAHILASQLIGYKLYTLHSDNTANEWNIKNGKLITQQRINGYQDYEFHQSFDSNHVLLRSKKTRSVCLYDRSNPIDVTNEKLKTGIQQFLYSELKNVKQIKAGKERQGIEERFKISKLCSQTVAITDYKLILFQSKDHGNDMFDDNSANSHTQHYKIQNDVNKFSIGDVEISEVMAFEGPCNIENNNLGLFSASNFTHFIFNFRDPSGHLQHYYYKVVYDSQTKSNYLNFYCQANQNVHLSMHSKDLQYVLQENNLSGDLNLTKFNDHIIELGEDEKQDRLKWKDHLLKMYRFSETVPSFISDREVVFINSDNIITNYNLLDQEIKSTMTRCPFVGIEQGFKQNTMIKSNSHIIGEDIMLMEIYKDSLNPNADYELVAPNNFNEFFKQLNRLMDHEARDSSSDNKHIQYHFKTKIGIMPRSYFGYIFQVKEFLPREAYQSDIHIVNTFSYYHWRLIKQVKRQTVNMDDLDRKLFQELCFTQLPDGSTLLHHIITNEELVEQLFKIVREDKVPFYVPILQDQKGKTVFDYLLEPEQNDTIFRYNHKLAKNGERISPQQKQNMGQVAVCIMNNMSEYPYDLYKLRLSHLIEEMINADIWAFSKFLDSRCRPLKIYDDTLVTKKEQAAVVIFSSNEVVYQHKLNMEQVLDSNNPAAQEMQIKVLEMPFLHCEPNNDHWGYDTLNLIIDKFSLNDSDDIFGNDAIKALIEVRWHFIKVRIIWFLMIPHIISLGVLSTYLIEDLESYKNINENDLITRSNRFRIVILVFTAYFFLIQIVLLIKTGFLYFKRQWNYYDVLSFMLITTAEAVLGRCRRLEIDNDEDLDYCNTTNDYIVRTLYSFVILFVFAKCLYFFRVYRSTGYYIRMFVEVVHALSHFVFIFLFQILAFSISFFVFQKNGTVETQPTMESSLQFAYLASFDYYSLDAINGDYKPYVSWFLFLILNFILQIVMLNLLISIVSDTYGRIKGNYNVIMYKDMMHLINENKLFSFGKLPKVLSQKYLFVASPKATLTPEEINSNRILSSMDAVMLKIKDVRSRLKRAEVQMKAIGKLEDREQRIQGKLEKMESKEELIMAKLDLLLSAQNLQPNRIVTQQSVE